MPIVEIVVYIEKLIQSKRYPLNKYSKPIPITKQRFDQKININQLRIEISLNLKQQKYTSKESTYKTSGNTDLTLMNLCSFEEKKLTKTGHANRPMPQLKN